MKIGFFLQFLGLFVLLVLLVSIVYNGLRREDVGEIVRVGIKRGFAFVGVSLLVFGIGGFLLAQWL
jgi:hypothetical protein